MTDGAAGSPAAGRSGFDRRLIAPMILGSALNPINSTMLAVALVPIGRAFDVSPASTAWLVSGLYLATAVGQPVIGRFVDNFGPRPLYLAGTGLVGLAGLLGFLAPSLGVLIVSRVLLGIGTSAAYPASMYLLRSEAARTGLRSPAGILAALTASSQVITVIGPALGGLLIGTGDWRLIFGVNLPLSVACLTLGTLWIPRNIMMDPSSTRGSVDVPGMVLFGAMLTAFMLFLMRPGVGHWYLPVLAILAGTAFAYRELHTDPPFIDLRVLRGNLPLLATYARQVLAYTISYAFLYGYSQWLQEGHGLSAPHAGLLMLPLSGAAIAITALTGRRAAVRGKLLAGSVMQVLATTSLLFLGAATPIWALAGVGVLAGVPQGLNGLANQNALYAQADPLRMGSSAGLLRTATYMGALLAAAANATFFSQGATTSGLHNLAVLLLSIAAVFLLTCIADRSLGHLSRPPSASLTSADH